MSSNFLSNITGFNSQYIQTDAAKFEDETDYSEVDFCQGDIDEKETETTFNFDTPIELFEADDYYKNFDEEG